MTITANQIAALHAECRKKVISTWNVNGWEKSYPIDGAVFNNYVESALKNAVIAHNARAQFATIEREDYQRGGSPVEKEAREEAAHFKARTNAVRKENNGKYNTRQAINSGLV